MGTLLQDVRYGVRMLFKNRSFTLIAVLALALGIGANTAIFSVVNAVLLRPLPLAQPERLLMVWATHPLGKKIGLDQLPTSPADFADWRRAADSFEQMSAMAGGNWNLSGMGEAERLNGARVSTNLLALLGARPQLGRDFASEEETFGKNHVVILSDGLWQRRFGGDPRVLGRTMTLDGDSYQVIGVMPKDFSFPQGMGINPALGLDEKPALWTPLALPPDQVNTRQSHYLAVVGRLKPGAPYEQARTQMNAIAKQIEEQNPRQSKDWGATINPLHEQVVGHSRPAILLLLGAVGFVLLIACANVANLLLTRATARHKEFAIRAALGESRWRTVRQLLIESGLLALLGGGLGLVFAAWGVESLVALSPGNLPRATEIGIDARVLLFTFTLALVTGFVFGLAPALQSSRPDLNEILKEGGRGTTATRGQQRARAALVVAEVALSLVLLIGAGLLIKSFLRLQNVNPGFDYGNVLTMTTFLPDAKFTADQQRADFQQQVIARVRQLPGVETVGGISQLPLGGSEELDGFDIEGRPELNTPENLASAAFRLISPDYFRALRIPLLKGRFFNAQDTADAQGVMIIDETFARRYFPDEDPIGKRVDEQGSLTPHGYMTIVGVVAGVKHKSLDSPATPTMYLTNAQSPWHTMTLTIRSQTDPAQLAGAVRREIAAVDPEQPVSDVETMQEVFKRAVAPQRFNSLLLAVFAVLAMLLASVGIYGVIAYSVAQRRHELGVRIALGARGKDILRLVVGQALTMALVGVGLGLVAAFALTRLMNSLLYETSASDPEVFVAVALMLLVVAFLASYLPARRATKVDPMIALRYE